MIEMQLAQITMEDLSTQHVIVLKEKNGDRAFPIVIGVFEALAIRRIIDKDPFPRPLTHDLVANVIEAMGGKLVRMAVTQLVPNPDGTGTYHASLYIEQDGKVVEVDSRPSDAIALAMKAEVPIFVDEQVLEQLERESKQEENS